MIDLWGSWAPCRWILQISINCITGRRTMMSWYLVVTGPHFTLVPHPPPPWRGVTWAVLDTLPHSLARGGAHDTLCTRSRYKATPSPRPGCSQGQEPCPDAGCCCPSSSSCRTLLRPGSRPGPPCQTSTACKIIFLTVKWSGYKPQNKIGEDIGSLKHFQSTEIIVYAVYNGSSYQCVFA